MKKKKLWVIREIPLGDKIAHRQSTIEYDCETSQLIRPDDRLGEAGKEEWDRVIKRLSNLGGDDLRRIVDGPGLLDHCLEVQNRPKKKKMTDDSTNE